MQSLWAQARNIFCFTVASFRKNRDEYLEQRLLQRASQRRKMKLQEKLPNCLFSGGLATMAHKFPTSLSPLLSSTIHFV